MSSNRIRKLTPNELALVCGGALTDTITVGGGASPYWPSDEYDPWDQPDYGGGSGGGGGGGGGDTGFTPLAAENRVDEAFIAQQEGQQQLAGYVPNNNGIVIGQSGVTVATGVDLGSKSAAQLAALGVDQNLITLLTPYLGLTGQAALQAIQAHPITITDAQADQLDNAIRGDILNKVVTSYDAASDYADFYQLPAGVQTAIASVAYQYGPNLSSAAPNFWAQITEGRWQDAVNNLNDFGDVYDSRREREADLIENDIASGALPPTP